MEKTHSPWSMRVASSALLLATLYLLFFPRRASQATAGALWMSVRTVVPAVFPYLVLSGTFIGSGLADRAGQRLDGITRRLFGLPGCCGGAILLGIVCGFPVGGKMAGMLYSRGSITKAEAERLLSFSNFCGPPYILTVLGAGVLKSVQMGFVIFGVQTVLSLIAGIVLGKGHRQKPAVSVGKTPLSFGNAFTDAVKNACTGTLHICGYVTFFAVLMSALVPVFSCLSVQGAALLYGFFEMSGGILQLENSAFALVPATAILFWSGLSVFMQVESAAATGDGQRLSMRLYLLVRAVTVPFGTAAVYFLCRMFGLIA